MSCLVNQPGELVGEAIDVVDELFADPMVVTNFFLWCYDQVFCPFSQKAGVPMLRVSIDWKSIIYYDFGVCFHHFVDLCGRQEGIYMKLFVTIKCSIYTH